MADAQYKTHSLGFCFETGVLQDATQNFRYLKPPFGRKREFDNATTPVRRYLQPKIVGIDCNKGGLPDLNKKRWNNVIFNHCSRP